MRHRTASVPAPPQPALALPSSPPPPLAPVAQLVVIAASPATSNAVVAGLAICMAMAVVTVMLFAGGKLMKRRRNNRLRRARGQFAYDVFLSYRRADGEVVDSVTDKLRQEGLRVFLDRSGDMSGRPFDRELLRALRSSACCTPVVTVNAMVRLASVGATGLDYTLIEYVLALHLALTGQLKLLYPLMVGEEVSDASEDGRLRRDVLWANPAFKAARDALPDVVPTATLAFADALLRAEMGPGATLHSALREATVRQLMCSRSSDVGFTGLLMHDACLLTGPREDAELYVRHRYAANVKTLVYGSRPSQHINLVSAQAAPGGASAGAHSAASSRPQEGLVRYDTMMNV